MMLFYNVFSFRGENGERRAFYHFSIGEEEGRKGRERGPPMEDERRGGGRTEIADAGVKKTVLAAAILKILEKSPDCV